MNWGSTAIEVLPGVSNCTMEEATPDLRWRTGILEQRWFIRRIGQSGMVIGVDQDWRPVPTVNE